MVFEVARTIKLTRVSPECLMVCDLVRRARRWGDSAEAGVAAYLHQASASVSLFDAWPTSSAKPPAEEATLLSGENSLVPNILCRGKNLCRTNILLAEDNIVNQKVAVVSTKLGYRPTPSPNGREAVEALGRIPL